MSISTQLMQVPGCARIERVKIGHALVHAITFDQALDVLVEHAQSGQATAHVVTPNAQHVVLLEGDLNLRLAYADATLVLPDGASLLMAARVLASPLKERVTGVDLFQSLCGRAAQTGLRVFLLGGSPGSAEIAAEKLTSLYPGLVVAGTYCPPFGFERDEVQLQKVRCRIRSAAPHFLFVGLGAPKQEYWIHQYGSELNVPVCVGIGGAFEMVAGLTPRAPRWMQVTGFEWLFRLCAEPRRLWKRYLIGNLQFMAIVGRQWFASNPPSGLGKSGMELRP